MSEHIEPEPKGIPVVAEALGYVGGALALAAVIALVARFWVVLGPAGHVGVGLVLAATGLIGGFVLERMHGDAAKRLSQFLLLAGVAGVGVAAGFAVRWAIDLSGVSGESVLPNLSGSRDDWAWFAGMAAAAISGGLIWWWRRNALQHLAFGVSVAMTALLSLPLMPIDGPDWGAGATLVLVALVWGALSLGDRLPPRVVGLTLAALGIVGGIEIMALSASPMVGWAMWLGVVACAALIWAGSRLEELSVLGIGTVGLMVFSAEIVGEYLGFGAGTAIALIAVGFVLLGVGVRLTLSMKPDAAPNRRITSEVAGYLGVALAMGGAGILMGTYWAELGTAGHIAVPLAGALVAYGCALSLRHSDSTAAGRLSQVLYAIGVLAAGITGAMIAQPVTNTVFGVYEPDPSEMTSQIDYGNAWTVLAGTVTATVFGGVTWWLRKGALTQAVFFIALVANVMATMAFVPPDSANMVMIAGAALVTLGTIWGVFGALERITPPRTALVMGPLAALLGLQMMTRGSTGELNTWAAVLGIAYGIAGIVASIYLKRATLLGFGAVYIIIFATTMVMELFGGRAGGPIVLLALGVISIAVAVVSAKLAPRIRRTRST